MAVRPTNHIWTGGRITAEEITAVDFRGNSAKKKVIKLVYKKNVHFNGDCNIEWIQPINSPTSLV